MLTRSHHGRSNTSSRYRSARRGGSSSAPRGLDRPPISPAGPSSTNCRTGRLWTCMNPRCPPTCRASALSLVRCFHHRPCSHRRRALGRRRCVAQPYARRWSPAELPAQMSVLHLATDTGTRPTLRSLRPLGSDPSPVARSHRHASPNSLRLHKCWCSTLFRGPRIRMTRCGILPSAGRSRHRRAARRCWLRRARPRP